MNRRKRHKKLFHSPIAYNLEKEDGAINIDCIAYSEQQYTRQVGTTWQSAAQYLSLNSEHTLWVNLYPIENKEIIEELGAYFDINPFLMSDAVDFSQRPKSWFTETHLFCSFKMIKPGHTASEHISFILGKNYIISFQEEQEDVFEHIRERIANNFGLIRKQKVDYLFFLLCDALIDQYTLISDQSEDYLLALEEQMAAKHDTISLKELHVVRRNLSGIHKDIRAATDVLTGVLESEFFSITDFVRKLFSSITHNSRYSLDSLSRQLDQTKNLSDLYFAQQNNRLNEMIKLLTIMSAFFIPLTFIAGLYGMNFKYMYELSYRWAYPAVLSFMAFISLLIFTIFRKKRWL